MSRRMTRFLVVASMVALIGAVILRSSPAADEVDGIKRGLDADALRVAKMLVQVQSARNQGSEFEAVRNELFAIPGWEKHAWTALEAFVRKAEITHEYFGAYERRQEEIIRLLRTETESQALLDLMKERDVLGREIRGRRDASLELSALIGGLGALRSDRALPLVAPILDSQGIAILRGPHRTVGVPKMAEAALANLQSSGVQIPGAPPGGETNWREWWKREKGNYQQFRLGTAVASAKTENLEPSQYGRASLPTNLQAEPERSLPSETKRPQAQEPVLATYNNVFVYGAIVGGIAALVVLLVTIKRSRASR